MFTFAPNLSLLFTHVPFLARFALARKAGFRRVEFQFPYDFDAVSVARAARDAGVEVVLFNVPAGNFAAGDRGLASHPDRVDAFKQSLDQALEYADALGCPRLNVLAGKREPAIPLDAQRVALIDNVRHAARALQHHGVTAVVEMLNPVDAPGFMLPAPSAAFELQAAVGEPNLKVQYDVYHAQRTEGELGATLSRHIGQIGHIQIADTPGRHQPGTGEINYRFVLRHLRALGYAGSIGLEYYPDGPPEASFGWIEEYGFVRG